MKKKIYVLRGKAQIGKTSTIKIIVELLKKEYPNAQINVILDGYDVKVIITINNVKVGIESQGDPNSRLKDSLADFVKKECSIIICPARTRGMTNDWITAYSDKYEIIWIEKNIAPNGSNKEKENKINETQASSIVNTYLSNF